ncbi:hypothetical protein FACS189473_3910 [Spirochaetia bacterium]|nr:hypothetical protein FACS189473_3910 [Spirochaetia bacterium]
MGELRRIASEGIPKEEIDAALLSMEFSHREIRRSGGPYSLAWLRRSLRGWLHGTKPWDSLLFMPSFSLLKERLTKDNRYFESLIQKYFIDNPHRALVVIEPQEGYLEKQKAALAASLAKREAALTSGERQAITEKSAELDRIQSEGEDPAALATIPHLSRKDLSREIEITPRELHDAAGVPVLTHSLFTNGITYIDIAFPLDVLSPEDYRWLPLFSRCIVSMGLPGMDYAAVSSLLARTTGGFHAVLETGSPVPGTAAAVSTPGGILDLCGRDWLMYRLKALDEKTAAALELAQRLITEADFSDKRRLRDLVLEMKNEVDSSLAPAGHSYAASRAGLGFSRSKTVEEIWSGLEQLNFVHTIVDGDITNLDIAGISRTLTSLRDRIKAGGCIVNITASAESLPGSLRLIEGEWSRFGPPKPRNPASQGVEPFLSLLRMSTVASSAKRPAEVFASPSLQVGFAALSLPGASYTSREHAAELVLSHQLSTGALWEDIRMKGGAYGAFAHPDGIEKMFFLSTYRDPNPLRSLGAFGSILQGRAGQKADEEALEKAIIGSYAKETRPRTAAEKGGADFSRFLYGVDDRHRARKLQSLVDITDGELAAAARRLAGAAAGPQAGAAPNAAPILEASSIIIAGTEAAKEAAARLGVEVQGLPV